MRIRESLQLILAPAKIVSDQGCELTQIDEILRKLPEIDQIYQQILSDVNGGKSYKTGREGLTAEQILKLGIIRKRHGLDYRELSFSTIDSMSIRSFLNLPMCKSLSKSAIHSNLKLVKESTWENVNELLLKYAVKEEIEDGKFARGDCTAVQTNIHYPTDAGLMNDVNRVLDRLMKEARQLVGCEVVFINHTKRSKKKLFLINNSRGEKKKHPHYLELIRVTRETVKYAEAVSEVLPNIKVYDLIVAIRIESIAAELKKYYKLAVKVVDQAYRRVVNKEEVPASEKIVSIFEEHTDIIVKGHRDVAFGHKILLSTGRSGLIFDLECLDGNPKDSNLVKDLIIQHKDAYGYAPSHLAFDGCFASANNRDFAKENGVQELTFSKNRSLDLTSLVSSPRIHKMLINFRAGVEGCISWMKRTFGFTRILDKSLKTFKASLQLGAIAYNLTVLARITLAKKAKKLATS